MVGWECGDEPGHSGEHDAPSENGRRDGRGGRAKGDDGGRGW